MEQTAKIAVMTFTYFLVNMLQFVFGGILDKVAGSFGVSIAAAGQLNTAYALAFAIGTPVIMVLGARMDRRRLFLASLAVVLAGTIMTAVLSDFLVLMAVRAVVGLAAGVCTVCGTAIIADAIAPQERGRALYALALGASVALTVGMPASRLITAFFDWRTIFGGITALLLVAFVAAARHHVRVQHHAVTTISRSAFSSRRSLAVSLRTARTAAQGPRAAFRLNTPRFA